METQPGSRKSSGASVPSVRIFTPPQKMTTRAAAIWPRNFHFAPRPRKSSTMPKATRISAPASHPWTSGSPGFQRRTGTNAPIAIAIPPQRGIARVWTFRGPGRSTSCQRTAIALKTGTRAMVIRTDSSNVERKITGAPSPEGSRPGGEGPPRWAGSARTPPPRLRRRLLRGAEDPGCRAGQARRLFPIAGRGRSEG